MQRFPAHDFLQSGQPSLLFRVNHNHVINTVNVGYTHLILKAGTKVQSYHIKRIPVPNFLLVDVTSQTKRPIMSKLKALLRLATLKCLEGGVQGQTNYIIRFTVYDFLEVGYISQTCRINN